MKTVGMAADHAGYTLKEELKSLLIEEGYKVEDFGTSITRVYDPEIGLNCYQLDE